MKQEDNDLLLQYLSASLPHGVEIVAENSGIVGTLVGLTKVAKKEDCLVWFAGVLTPFKLDEVKPYLRSMSSMTEEEWEDYQKIRMIDWVQGDIDGTFINAGLIVDWLNAHHFDYRGLIEKGLTIAVTESNNPYL